LFESEAERKNATFEWYGGCYTYQDLEQALSVLCPLESSTSQLLPMQYEDVHHPSSWNLLNDDAVILLHALACQVRHHLFPSAAYWIAYRATLTAWLQCMLHDNAVVSQHSLHGVGSVTDCTAATGLWD